MSDAAATESHGSRSRLTITAALVCSGVVCLTLVGCGGSKGSTSTTTTTTTSTTSTTTETSPETTTTAAQPAEAPDAFLKRLLDYDFKGQFGRTWDELHPGHQAIVSRERFEECAVKGFPSNVELASIETVEVYDDPIHVYGIPQTTSKAVTLKLTVRQGSQTETDTVTLHAVLDDGRWVWILAAWKLRSPRTGARGYVICTAEGDPVQERNLRRALEAAKKKAKLSVPDSERLSWHSLRHSWASMLATDLELPATTLARLTGHADAGFTLRVYARDRRDEAAVVEDVLARASGAVIGG